MRYIDNPYTDAGLNLAAEEYLLNSFPEDVLMVWQNKPSVIVGKHQDVPSEVNLAYTNHHRIPVYRRLSGGGTVYHDAGNLNLSFIETGAQPDFTKYTERIRKALSEMGVDAIADERNALFINGRKISGSAQFLRKGKVLFHATLLFASNLNALIKSLDSPIVPSERRGTNRKRVPSVKSPVTNIYEHLSEPISIETFKHRLLQNLIQSEHKHTPYTFSEEDLNAITCIKKEKYETNRWNYQA